MSEKDEETKDESMMSNSNKEGNHERKRVRVKKKKKKSPGKKVFLTILTVLLVIIVGAGAVAAKMYLDVKNAVKDTHETVDRIEPSVRPTEDSVDMAEKDPFSVLLLGVDTGELGRTEQGRSDTIMVATVNPNTKKTTLTSIPRDIYSEIVGHGTSDKINHAYAFGGAAMSIATLENLLNVPLDHFVQINMKGLEDLVDAVGGIEVQNTLDFTIDDYTFAKGPVMLDGKHALAYIRMRYDDPNGDFGRQGRQRDVIQAVVKKVLNMNNITQYQTILNAVSANMKTDLTWDEMKDIALNYRDAFSTMTTDQLQAEGGLSDGTYGEKGIYYQHPTEAEITRVHDAITSELAQAQ